MPFKLFKLKQGELQLERDEVLLIKPFAAIWKDDTGVGVKGDSDGRKHLLSMMKYKYIYLTCDPYSYPAQQGYTEKEAINYALKHSDLPIEYIKDKNVLEAMEWYLDNIPTQTQQMVVELRLGINNSKRAMAKINALANDILENEKATKADILDLINLQERIFELVDTVGSKLNTLAELEKIAEDEVAVVDKRRGGGDIKRSMNPDTAI